ncbi:hypothetical protein F2P81_016945 [Scophthalmus maximus]|uniref:Uncharacterized protein n=1 Tax=Scophthalmus maximus TaxID=52904 RepID=A0A6A4SH05_SCOMX|nr:hypothetical protein F2P81_016945 [Scophthalmus maximus]
MLMISPYRSLEHYGLECLKLPPKIFEIEKYCAYMISLGATRTLQSFKTLYNADRNITNVHLLLRPPVVPGNAYV